MRRVKYFELQLKKDGTAGSPWEENYNKVEIGKAWFHEWGVNGSHAAAIIELDNGEILYPTADMIQFITPTSE